MGIINVNILNINENVQIEEGITLLELANKYKEKITNEPLIATVDNEIELHQLKLSDLKKQRKALQQYLLNGIVRV